MSKATTELNKFNRLFILTIVLLPLISGCNKELERYPDIEDGSAWIEAIEPGFNNKNNYAVVAMAEYDGYFYAMTRNEVDGAEIWRSPDGKKSTWKQVIFPNGESNGVYGNKWLTSMWGSLIVFKGKLYCGFSSGHQGNVYDSTGCEIWRYDGNNWEAVISDKKDRDDFGVISKIANCSKGDGDPAAQITDDTQNWQTDEWRGGILQVTSGDGKYRRFDIVGNSSNTLTIQQNEKAGDADDTEFTICDTVTTYKNRFPSFSYSRGIISVGDEYEIGIGNDENGFGDFWNKMITEMIVFKDKLYVSTGLNYDHGAQVWYTKDGDTWTVTRSKLDVPEPYNTHSFGNFHTNPEYKDGYKPISTSIPSMVVSSVSGEAMLYAGGTGASGGRSATRDKGRCARIARLTDEGWELIVDVDVDENDTGSNENGFGCGMECTMFNGDFMPWSLAEYKNRLYVGIQSLAGTRILYTDNASKEDGAWHHSVGGASNPTGMPNGFDGKINPGINLLVKLVKGPIYQNIVTNLFTCNDALYAGLVSIYAPNMGADEKHLTGAHLWKSFDGISWKPITRNGFGNSSNIGFDAFAEMGGNLYVSTNRASVDGPDGLDPPRGGMIYKLTEEPNRAPKPAFTKTFAYSTTMPQNNDEADIYYPVPEDNDSTSHKFPVALFLQGGKVDKKHYSKYASELAKYGFIVVVPNHYEEYTLKALKGLAKIDFKGFFPDSSQIYDVIDFTTEENTRDTSPLKGIVDNETLVLTGHSFGAAAIIGAIQEECVFPLCRMGTEFKLPDIVKAAALTGINTIPHGNPFDNKNHPTENLIPMAIINGDLDENAEYQDTKNSYALIENTPKALIFIKGSNHYGLCDVNNPGNPDYPEADKVEGVSTPQKIIPTLDQNISIETNARWAALFLSAHALNDAEAMEYISTTGKFLDPNVEVIYDGK